MSAAGLFASIRGTRIRKKANRALDRELANAPKYRINEEAFENQAMAKSQAFGRDRSIQMGQENIAQSAVNASGEARDITSSTSALMSTIAQIEQNKMNQLRGLSQDEAVLQQQKMQNLQGVNNQMIDEKDKAWNYNQNMPFQMRVAKYRDQAKVGSEMELAGVAAQAQTEAAFASSLGSMGSMMGGCDERIKDKIEPSEIGLEQVMKMNPVTFEYTIDRFGKGTSHIGFIAQQMENVVPQAVGIIHGMAKEGEKEYLMIDFKELVPVLVKAIQEQQKQIDQLKSMITVPDGHFIPGSKLEEMRMLVSQE